MQKSLEEYFENNIESKEYRKSKQQGYGRNIDSKIVDGYRIIKVGANEYNSKDWHTFHDFLFFYFSELIGRDWLSNNDTPSHPIKIWHKLLLKFIKAQETNSLGNFKAECTGSVEAILRLSYNLYLLAHNVEIQRKLIKRLKDIQQFQGAYYETFVASYLIYSGFDVEIEDENNGSSKHHDYIATVKETGKKYSVEVKSCSRKDILGSMQGNDNFKSIGDHIYGALSKPTEFKRIIFIEANTDKQNWQNEVFNIVDQKEKTLTINGSTAPSAYIFLTNHNYHYHLDDTAYKTDTFFTGFKMNDFHPPFTQGFIEFEIKHIDCIELFNDIQNFEIPSTFNGENPNIEFAESKESALITEIIKTQENNYQKTPAEMDDFYYKTYKETPKANLLKFIDPNNKYPELQMFSQYRLAKLLCRLSTFYKKT